MSERHSIPFFGVAREFDELGASFVTSIERVLRSGAVLQGVEVEDFENQVAALTNRDFAVACGSCTDALFFALRSLDIGPGDEVLVPDYTFIASASAIMRSGATPVFVDIDAQCQLDLERAADQVTPNTKAMVYVQLYGGVGDPAAIQHFASENGLAVVEDFAQSLGASWGERPAGSFGHVGAVSFDPTKIIGAPGSAGALVTDDPQIAERVRRLRYHGKGSDFEELGYNSQLPSLTAAVLSDKLNHLSRYTARSRDIAAWYEQELREMPVTTLECPAGVIHARHKFTLNTDRRDGLRSYLDRQGIETRIHYSTPLHREPLFVAFGGADSEFPAACQAAATTLSIPVHAFVRDAEVEHVATSIQDFFAG